MGIDKCTKFSNEPISHHRTSDTDTHIYRYVQVMHSFDNISFKSEMIIEHNEER